LQQVNAPSSQTVPSMPQANALELKDIHVPEQISNFPVAYGWWLLAAFLILIVVISIIKIRKASKRNQVKKQALTQLNLLLESNSQMAISDTIALLKWAAMHYFSRVELAKLFGDSLQTFLTVQLPIKHQKSFTDLSGQAFHNQYQVQPKISENADNHTQIDEDFYQAAKLWLTHALPPKTKKVASNRASIDDNKSQGDNT